MPGNVTQAAGVQVRLNLSAFAKHAILAVTVIVTSFGNALAKKVINKLKGGLHRPFILLRKYLFIEF